MSTKEGAPVDLTMVDSIQLRDINKERSLNGLPPVNVTKVIEDFAEYLKEKKTAVTKYGLKGPSKFKDWSNRMLENIKHDTDGSWMFALPPDKLDPNSTAVAFASIEVMAVSQPSTRNNKDKPPLNDLIYLANVCSNAGKGLGVGRKVMEQLIEQVIGKMRSSGVVGDITVMLNFTPDEERLFRLYSAMGFTELPQESERSDEDKFKLSIYAGMIKDSVHSKVMYRHIPEPTHKRLKRS
jgi:hypothetical protein